MRTRASTGLRVQRKPIPSVGCDRAAEAAGRVVPPKPEGQMFFGVISSLLRRSHIAENMLPPRASISPEKTFAVGAPHHHTPPNYLQ